ncbi:MAG: ABC transporter substrate-binding protein [Dehalococcoidia bacterium]|nr:ABC transporter substrate-binding protein [Dehalococcoidia bacterium]
MDDITTTERIAGWRLDRRAALRGGTLALGGLAAAALIGCGGSDDNKDSGSGGATATGTSAASNVDKGDAQRGLFVKDDALPYPYNYPEPKKDPKPGGTLRVAATWDVGPMDPTVSAAGGTVTVPNMVYNRLIGVKRGPTADPFKMELQPELAQSWERTPDGLTYTFKIRNDIKWQNIAPLNGRQFVAADAAFALNRYMTEGVHKAYYVNVDSIEAVDASTLKIKMKRAVADFLNPIASDKQTIFPKELVDNGEIGKKVIGTGPMILQEATAGQRVTFTKNPDYFARKVLLDGFEFKIMPDLAARVAAFRTGQVEYAYSPISTPSELDNLKKSNPDIQINMVPLTYMTFTLAMNLTDPKYQDERVRRALSMAINRQQLVQFLGEGLGKALNIIPWTYVLDKEPTIESGALGKWMKYAPDESKALLAAAGADKLQMKQIYYAYSAANDKTVEVAVPMLQAVGVSISGGKVDYNEFNSQWVGAKLPDATMSGWGTAGFDADNWFYAQVQSKSPGNRWRINDPQIDAWADQQQTTLDPAARREIQKKIWDRDLDMMYRPSFPAGFGYEVLAASLRGVRWGQGSPNSNSSYYNWGSQVENAWLDK